MSSIKFPKHIPHKLHLVTLIRSGIRRPWWEKRCLKRLGLERLHQSVVLPNTPFMNSELSIIKTRIRVQPIVINNVSHDANTKATHADLFDDMEAKSFNLISGTFLNQKGEFNLKEYLKYVDRFPDDELEEKIKKSHVYQSDLLNRDFIQEAENNIVDKGEKIELYFQKETWPQPKRLETRTKNLTKH